MVKRIVNKAERNAERYDAKEMGYQLYEDSLNGEIFDRLMPMIVSEQNIILAYRNICKNNGNKTPGTELKEMQDKINKLQEHREFEIIQFEDYIGTKK